MQVTAAFIINLMAFAALGIGPAVWCLSGPGRVSTAITIAPAVGLSLVSVFGTLLTARDLPVAEWAAPTLVIGVFLSIVLLTQALLREQIPGTKGSARDWMLPLLAFLITAVAVIAPQLIGGLQYSILRGNGTDSFNYVAAAGYLDHEPLSWAFQVDAQALVDRHPTYVRVHQLLTDRWAVMMNLAFSSRIAGIKPYKFEFGFSIMCVLMAFGPAFLWCQQLLDLRRRWSALVAAAICAGFWGQFLVDERADAHQNAIPFLLLIGWLTGRIEQRDRQQAPWGEHALLGAAIAALIVVYPEVVPMTLAGMLLFLGARVFTGQVSTRRGAGWAFSAALATLAASPQLTSFFRTVVQRAGYGFGSPNTWHEAYFSWLYASPLSGAWGLAPFVWFSAQAGAIGRVFPLALGATLTVVLGLSLVHGATAFRSRPQALLAPAFVTVCLIQSASLYFSDQLWATGKSLSYGYPFFFLAVADFALSPSRVLGGWRGPIMSTVRLSVVAFLMTQLGLAAYRPWLAAWAREYPEYIAHHGSYRQHHWDFSSFERVLAPQRSLTVWADVPEPALSEYLPRVLGWDVHFLRIGSNQGDQEVGAPQQSVDRPPQYIIVDNAAAAWAMETAVVARTPELSLISVTNEPVITKVENANGFEHSLGRPYLWLGGGPTVLHVAAPSAGCAVLRGQFSMGPSRPDLNYRRVTWTDTADASPHSKVLTDGAHDLHLRLLPGVNEIRLTVDEQATVFPDTRPLMLRLGDLRFAPAGCVAGRE